MLKGESASLMPTSNSISETGLFVLVTIRSSISVFVFLVNESITFCEIKTTNFDKIGLIVDAVINNGGIIQNIKFEITQETQNKLKSEALKIAAEDAKNKAMALAEGSGSNLGNLVSISSQEFNYFPNPIYARASDSETKELKQSVTNLSPKELSITANVQSTYKIK